MDGWMKSSLWLHYFCTRRLFCVTASESSTLRFSSSIFVVLPLHFSEAHLVSVCLFCLPFPQNTFSKIHPWRHAYRSTPHLLFFSRRLFSPLSRENWKHHVSPSRDLKGDDRQHVDFSFLFLNFLFRSFDTALLFVTSKKSQSSPSPHFLRYRVLMLLSGFLKLHIFSSNNRVSISFSCRKINSSRCLNRMQH